MIKWYAKTVFPRFIAAEDGPTAVEYAVIIALIVITCIGSVSAVGLIAQSIDANKVLMRTDTGNLDGAETASLD